MDNGLGHRITEELLARLVLIGTAQAPGRMDRYRESEESLLQTFLHVRTAPIMLDDRLLE